MPSHSHTYNVWQVSGSGSAYATMVSDTLKPYRAAKTTNETGGGEPHNHGETTSSLSSAQSILNPYITVYIWKRIS